MEDVTLQRFRRFKEMIISSSVPNNVLLELLESYLTTDTDEPVIQEIPILDGQLSLYDLIAS